MRKTIISLAGLLSLAACATEFEPVFESVSVRYDPYNYSVANLHRSADAECLARGFGGAEEEPVDLGNPGSGAGTRWDYMEFDCF